MQDEAGKQALSRDLAMLGAIAYVIFLAMSIAPILLDGDTGWHIAAGRWMIEHRAVPGTDPFSFTFFGEKWTPHEWMSELIMVAAYEAAGWSGIAILFAAAVTTLFLLLGIELRRWMPSTPAFVTLLTSFAMLLPFLLARPHLLALPILAGWTIMLLRAREAGRAPAWPFAATMLLWANLHGSFLFGLALIAPFALEAVIAGPKRTEALLGWGGFGLLSALIALLTPHGIDGILFPVQVAMMKSLPLIVEWRAASFENFNGFQLSLMIFLLFALTKGLRIPAVRLLLLLGLLYLGLQHIRHQMILAVVGTLLIAEPVGRALLAPGGALPKPALRAALAGNLRTYRPAALAMAVIIAAIISVRLLIPVQRSDSDNVPATALAKLPDALRTERVFNDYGFGGALILAGIPVYIDGRADMYGDAFLENYVRIKGGDAKAWRAAARRWKIKWTILTPSVELVAVLDREPGWRRVYADKYAVIHSSVP